MCGICGKYSPTGVHREEIAVMLHMIAHRGPDDEGIYLNGPIGLGNRRLSIIDLHGGRQPICNEDETIWVVYNGEIYNYRQLHQDLENRGHAFKTNSDTEVIVHLYEEYGENFVDALSGMFAIAIWDGGNQKLILARDRFGQKPLFYANSNGNFIFASEIKAILTDDRFARDVDYEALHHYLSLRFIPSPRTLFQSIKKMPPAHILVWQNGYIHLKRYWQLSFHDKLNLSDSEAIDGLEEKLEKTIRAHMVSDVPLGAFLSGGMDSSMIVAMMAKNSSESIQTFAIGVKEQSFNELPYARMVADQYQTRHTELVVESNLVSLLPKMIWHLDEPSDPIAACQFNAAELAAHHVKVVMGGDGGDELFAGFDRYLGIGYLAPYALLPISIRRKIIGPIIDHVSENFQYKSISQKLRWAHQVSMLTDIGERYAEATCFFRFSQEDKHALYSDDLWKRLRRLNSADIIVNQFNRSDAESVIDKMLYADFMTRLPEHSLMLTDRMAMAHGLETRSPYLDNDLVEFLAAFPERLKIRGRKLKYALRSIAKRYLPDKIVKRKKQGFMFPVAYWFRNELYSFLKSFLLESYFVKNGLFKRESVLRLIEEHRHNRVDNHVRLWMLLNLEIWHQLYISGQSIAAVCENLEDCLRLNSDGR